MFKLVKRSINEIKDSTRIISVEDSINWIGKKIKKIKNIWNESIKDIWTIIREYK